MEEALVAWAAYMKLLGRLAQGRVVLLDEIPADLVLGKILGVGIRPSIGRLASSSILLVIDTVGCHDCSTMWKVRGGRRANLKARHAWLEEENRWPKARGDTGELRLSKTASVSQTQRTANLFCSGMCGVGAHLSRT